MSPHSPATTADPPWFFTLSICSLHGSQCLMYVQDPISQLFRWEVGSVGDVCRPTDIWVILATVLGHLGAAFAASKLDILNNKLGRFPAEFVAASADILRERRWERLQLRLWRHKTRYFRKHMIFSKPSFVCVCRGLTLCPLQSRREFQHIKYIV